MTTSAFPTPARTRPFFGLPRPAGPAALSTLTLVQSVTKAGASGGDTITLGAAPTLGNFLVATSACAQTTLEHRAYSAGIGWYLIEDDLSAAGSQIRTTMWIGIPKAGASASTAFVYTNIGALIVAEFKPAYPSSAVDMWYRGTRYTNVRTTSGAMLLPSSGNLLYGKPGGLVFVSHGARSAVTYPSGITSVAVTNASVTASLNWRDYAVYPGNLGESLSFSATDRQAGVMALIA